jgi:hypothetical protein
MKTTIRLADDLLRRARKKAAEEGRSLTSLVEEGLKTVLAESKVARLAKTTQNPAGDLKVVNNRSTTCQEPLSSLLLIGNLMKTIRRQKDSPFENGRLL